jgi:hypothetical protein
VVLDLKEQAEHFIALHSRQNIRVASDVPVEEMNRSAEKLLLKGTKALCWLTVSCYHSA